MTKTLPGPASNMAEFGAMMELAHAGDRPNHRPYEPQSGDVFISSWAKSGTTYMQQMFHQLRTGGHMDFDDISRMTPWEDSAYMIDMDMTAPQPGSPRGFKSHREYERLPAGQRYVVTLRDPKETFVSFHRFFDGWLIKSGSMSLEDFMPMWQGGGPGGCDYFTHLLSWYARRHEADSLVMTYKWSVKNRPAVIYKLAKHCGIDVNDALRDLVMERTTREFMSEHEHLFDDAMMCAVLEERCGVPAASDSTKVQKKGSSADALPASVAEQIDAEWAERVEPVTGHANFAALAAEIDALADERQPQGK